MINRKNGIILLLMILTCVVCVRTTSHKVQIEPGGTEIQFDFNSLHMIAETGPRIDGQYLVVGASIGREPFLALIPRMEAEKIKDQYGDFRNCSSPGAAKGQSATGTILVVTNDPRVKWTLMRISDNVTQRPELFVELEGCKLKLKRYYWGQGENRKEYTTYPNPAEFCYITSLNIL